MSKYNYNKDYFSIIDTADKAYWLGFLYADGCITRFFKNEKLRSMSLELTLCKEDKNHLNKFLRCLDSNIPIKEKHIKLNNNDYLAYKVVINCTKMCYDLIKLGCTPQKTFSLAFPNNDQVPEKYIKDFIRGYFDGDGCIHIRNNGGIELNITGLENMISCINDYLISKKILRVLPKIYKKGNVYEVFYYGVDSIKEILDHIYNNSNMYLDRKYKKYQDYYKNYNDKENKYGIYLDKLNNKYIAKIYINGKNIRIGQYNNIDDAINARKEAEINKMLIKNNMPA